MKGRITNIIKKSNFSRATPAKVFTLLEKLQQKTAQWDKLLEELSEKNLGKSFKKNLDGRIHGE